MRRKPYTTFTEHDATALAPAAAPWGPAGLLQNPPPPAGPDFFDPATCSDEDLELMIRQARIEDQIAGFMPWFERAAFVLAGVVLLLAAQPIVVAIRAAF